MSVAGLRASLEQLGQIQAHPSVGVAVLMAIVGFGAALVPGIWHVMRPLNTMAHEGAHATIGSAVGRTITKIDIKFNGNGATSHTGSDDSTVILFPAAFIGYLGPSAFGVGAAALIRAGHIVAVLWIAVLGLVVILFLAYKSVGVVLVLAALALLVWLLDSASVRAQVLTTYGITWFLLVSGVRIIAEHGKDAADAGILHTLTGIARSFWPIPWLLGALAALVFGATLLL
ncbi:MAG TPA: M50 family metallopeptidase [Streptosporangiaceae bacterium]|nr:M50 family metallopeptidase [Streptosporangiaceae bacterium]